MEYSIMVTGVNRNIDCRKSSKHYYVGGGRLSDGVCGVSITGFAAITDLFSGRDKWTCNGGFRNSFISPRDAGLWQINNKGGEL